MNEDWLPAERDAAAGLDHGSRAGVANDSALVRGILIGYARCSTERQDLTAQRRILSELGVPDDRVYLDHGLTGRNRSRPGMTQALAALGEGDTLVVPKLDRLARSVPDARAIGDSLAARGGRLSLGGTTYDPSDPMGECFFNILATFAEFEVDLLRMRTREGMAIARAKGKLKGKPPKLSPTQRRCCSSSTMLASTQSPNSPSCSQAAGRRFTANSHEATRRRYTVSLSARRLRRPEAARRAAPQADTASRGGWLLDESVGVRYAWISLARRRWESPR